MSSAIAVPSGAALLWTALITLPLLMPGARRRYGTIPVVIGVFGLGHQLYGWLQGRRRPAHELGTASHNASTRAAHLRPDVG